MTKKILTIGLAVLCVALASSPAIAAKGPHRYSPKPGAKCRKGYKRVVKHRHHRVKRFCVKRKARPAAKAPAPIAPERVKLHSHLDPTFTRDPLNPFRVTYVYSASATQEQIAEASFASSSAEEPAALPNGVLSLFSDGKLECAVNVGGSATGGECPVSYQALGQHTVTTIYTSGEQSATETEVETIQPLATSSAATVSFDPADPPTHSSGIWWYVGDLRVTYGATPATASASLGCADEPNQQYGVLTASGCFQFNRGSVANGAGFIEEHVYATAECPASSEAIIRFLPQPPENTEPVVEWPTAADLGQGTFHLRTSVLDSTISATNRGFANSEALTPLRVEFPC